MRLGIFSQWIPLLLFSSLAWGVDVKPRSLAALSEEDLHTLASKPDPIKHLDPYDPKGHLYKILIPRPPDTDNNTFVRQHLVNTLKDLKWHVEEDSFTDNTPYGEKRFTNVIATKDPDAPRRIILSAHFDSKFFPKAPQNQFVGATDSAAPCAILLDVAEALNPLLDARAARIKNKKATAEEEEAAQTTLQIVFFDGEEAFKDWSDTDSLYGARHLAKKWSKEFVTGGGRLNHGSTKISTIEHLVLLDLLGAKSPLITSWYLSTAWLFDGLVSAEHRLGDLGFFDEIEPQDQPADGGEWRTWDSFFVPRTGYDQYYGRIEDDHIPFLQKGVNIVHVIASPFPRVWHTIRDDASALDIPTMKRWTLIFRVFTAEYLRLSPSTEPNQSVVVERTSEELVSR